MNPRIMLPTHRPASVIKAVVPAAMFVWLAGAGTAFAADPVPPTEDPSVAALEVMRSHCFTCHGPDKQKGDVRFDQLEAVDAKDRMDLYGRMREAVQTGTMPPKSAPPLAAADRQKLSAWLVEQLTGDEAKKYEEKLRRPEAGNYADHDDLFSGKYADRPGFTPDRRWLVSEFIFDAKVNRILEHAPFRTIDGKRQFVTGDNHRRANLTNPFLLPTNSGVRYYANETLNGGHLLTMLTNVKEASDYMMELVGKNGRYLPAATEILAAETATEKTLIAREKFLNDFIDTLLRDVYGDKHEAMLPAFVPGSVPPPVPQSGTVKKAPFHSANPGQKELEVIFLTMRKLETKGEADAELIRKCEKDWFHHGHHPRTIEARVTFLNNYMDEWREQIAFHKYDQKHKPPVYKEPAAAEMTAIRETLRKNRSNGDTYSAVVAKCVARWKAEAEQARVAAGPPDRKQLAALVDQLFVKIHERHPTPAEAEKHTALGTTYAAGLGREAAIKKLIETLILSTEFVYRSEFGTGDADQYGRRMLSPRDASYALAYALTDSSPDAELTKAAAEGRLNTRADYEREVRRMLARRDLHYVIDESVESADVANFTTMPVRELRFFREFFGYPRLLPIFKDAKRFGANYDDAKVRLVDETDRWVEYVLEKDKDVFNKLLTADEFYVFHSGDNAAMKASSDRIRKIVDYFKDKNWREFTLEDLAKHKAFLAEVKMRGIDPEKLTNDKRYDPLRTFKSQMESFSLRLDKGQAAAAPYVAFPAHGPADAATRYGGRLFSPDVAKFFNVDLYHWDYPTEQPAKMPHRKGMLTHPAWLIAHAQNTETDPIHRGKWVREKLLAGTIPDVPITVDAVIPEDPHHTLRHRLDAKTNNDYCMSCHVKMNPLGLAFEMYDDFGRFRTEERLEYPENLVKKQPDKGGPEVDLRDVYKTLPVDPRGHLDGTGDPELDGDVTDALDLIDRLARSDRVRQSIIRHAFRYFLGRNETLSDSKTLIDADRAYLQSGGSFDAVIVSLLTSDSFIYRKAPAQEDRADAVHP